MNEPEQPLLPTFADTIPEYRVTKAKALQNLRDKGNILNQRMIVYMGYCALESATREEVYYYLRKLAHGEKLIPFVPYPSVLGRTHELIFEDKKLRCIGHKPVKKGEQINDVEILAPGVDTRKRVPRAKLAKIEIPPERPIIKIVIAAILFGFILGKGIYRR